MISTVAMTRGSLVGVKGKARILRELLASETFAQEVPRLRVQLLDSKYAEVLPILADTNVSVSVAPLAEVPMEEYETASSSANSRISFVSNVVCPPTVALHAWPCVVKWASTTMQA